jgi:hypothetical protein
MKRVMAEPKEKTPQTKSQKALELKQKYEALILEAKQEQLDIITGAVAELKDMGFVYTVSEGNVQPAPVKRATGAAKAKPKSNAPPKPEGNQPDGKEWKYCPQCGTWGDHDARKHRLENLAKKAQA